MNEHCLISVDMLPYSIINKRGFKHFVNICVAGFKIPSRVTISDEKTPELCNKTFEHIKTELN